MALALLVATAGCGRAGAAVNGDFDSAFAKMTSQPTSPRDTAAPELPRVLVDTRLTAPTGRRVSLARGSDLQRAIDDAQPGDVLLLAPGVEFAGNFVLPRKTGDAWITIRSAAPDAQLPAAEARITPAFVGSLPRLVSPNGDPTIRTEAGAHHYRLLALEITTAPGVTRNDAIVAFGGGQSTLADVPHHLIIDRSYVHGHDRLNTKRCVALNSATTAVIDSYLADCHHLDYDSQAIVGWNGPGPFKIVNDYLEGAGENVMFGGGDPKIDKLVPSDIEIRRNHFYKPMAWRGRWRIKNLFELKNAQRVLVEGNVFENCWEAAQAGFAIALKSENQDGHAPWSVTRDVTMRFNKIQNAAGGIDIMGTGTNVDEMANHILVRDNLFERIGAAGLGDLGRLWQLVEEPSRITFDHNTGFAPNAALMLDAGRKTFVTITNNLVARGQYGIVGSNQGEGTRAIAFYLPGVVIRNNVIIGAPAESYPEGNFLPPTAGDVGFRDAARGDFRLAATSRYRGSATDRRDPGADIDAVERATRGVALAQP